MYDEIKSQARAAMQELLELAAPRPGSLVVVGCSSSEIMGSRIGKGSTPEAAEAVVAGTEAIGQEAQAMREQFQWSYLNFGEDSLSVWYPAGTLPGREYPSGWGLDYRDLKDVLHLWAVPEALEP